MEKSVKASEDRDMIHVWSKLQSADHFHYIEKSKGFTPDPTPFDAYIYYMNALADLQIRVKREDELIHKADRQTKSQQPDARFLFSFDTLCLSECG